MRVGQASRVAYSPTHSGPESIWPAWLAAAVIAQAVRDASRNSSVDLLTRASARRFLAGSKAFLMWCDVAGFDSDRLRLLCATQRFKDRAAIPHPTGR
jgi:hypothetical protein